MSITVRHQSDGEIDIAILEGVATERALDQLCRCVSDRSAFAQYGAVVIDVTGVPADVVPMIDRLQDTAHALAGQHRWLTVVDHNARAAVSGVPGLVFADRASALRAIHVLRRLVSTRPSRHAKMSALLDLAHEIVTAPLRIGRALLG